MLRFRRVHLCAMFVLLVGMTTCRVSGQGSQRTIQEGVGWGTFIVGANANSLINIFGLPDKTSNGRMMRWDKAGFNCLLDDKAEAIELRFERRFKGITGSGVTFGMSTDKVRKIYGGAGQMEWRGGAIKLIWPSRGILIWFHNNAVSQIVIFAPQAGNGL